MQVEFSEMDIESLKREQARRASEVIREDMPEFSGTIVSGIDVAYQGYQATACAVTYDIATDLITTTKTGRYTTDVPYMPSLFQLREGPILIDMLRDMRETGPVLIDANGVLHPRGFGLASFVGMELNLQTIGVAKKLLLGEIGERIGDVAPIIADGTVAGMALWLDGRRRPVYVSIGHRVSLQTAVRIVKSCSRRGRIIPLHQAHSCAKREIARKEK